MPQQLKLPLLFWSTPSYWPWLPIKHNRASLLLVNKGQASLSVFSNVTACWNHCYCLVKLCFLSLQQFASVLRFITRVSCRRTAEGSAVHYLRTWELRCQCKNPVKYVIFSCLPFFPFFLPILWATPCWQTHSLLISSASLVLRFLHQVLQPSGLITPPVHLNTQWTMKSTLFPLSSHHQQAKELLLNIQGILRYCWTPA